jgi:hypothetical protein
MRAITRRLGRLELRKREETLAVATVGDARRLMEERLERMSLCLQGSRDRGEFVEPNPTFEEVKQMVHAHLEESRIRHEENEKRMAARRLIHRRTASRS